MIELENIQKSYELNGKQVLILKGISLFVSKGEFVSIMGPSGSGKSTLASILGCLSTQSSGTYRLNNVEVSSLGAKQLARLRSQAIGYVFQDFNLLPGLSAWENVALPLVYAGASAKERKVRAMECLAAVQLEAKANNRPFQLSGGQKQRVAIARALVNRPQFLFADEPCGALDKKTGQEILGIMQKLNMMGNTVIMVTHSPTDASYSKRIVHLVDGNIVRDEAVEKPTIGVVTANEEQTESELATKLWRIAEVLPEHRTDDLAGVRKLVTASKSRDAHIAATKAIVCWPFEQISDLIEAMFSSSDWVVRLELLKQVKALPTAERLTLGIRGLKDSNAWVRYTALSALRAMPETEFSPEQQSAMVNCFTDPDERVRATCCLMMSGWKHSAIDSMLAQCLDDHDGRVRANAVEALSKRGQFKTDSSPLTRLVNDKHNRVRANAALALAGIDRRLADLTAENMMTSTEAMTRSSGVWVYGMLAPSNAPERLLELLKAERDEIVINQLVKATAKLSAGDIKFKDHVDRILDQRSAA
jgi:putative ABC transport system ATP-binding protein